MGTFVQLKPDAIVLSAQTRVVKAEEYLESLEAGNVLEAAHNQAARIIKQAKQAYLDEKRRGYQDGLLEGQMNIAEQMMDTVGQAVDYFASIEKKVTDTVLVALQKIIGEIDEQELIHKVVHNALGVVRNQQQVTLRVSPEQLETVRGTLDKIMGDYPGISYIDVVGDARLEQGGCILESEMGIVDASLDVQLAAIRKALEKRLQAGR